MFKLSRIKDIKILYDTYEIPANFDIREEFPKFGIMKEPLEVELLIYPPFAVSVPESIWGENQKIEHNDDGSILFRATMSGKESMKKWILGMGASVRCWSLENYGKRLLRREEVNGDVWLIMCLLLY